LQRADGLVLRRSGVRVRAGAELASWFGGERSRSLVIFADDADGAWGVTTGQGRWAASNRVHRVYSRTEASEDLGHLPDVVAGWLRGQP